MKSAKPFADADVDLPNLTAEQLAKLRPAAEVHPQRFSQ